MSDPPDGYRRRRTQDEEALYQHLIEGVSSHAIFMLDSDGMITAWPTPARTLYGYESESMLGNNLRDLFADDGTAEFDIDIDEDESHPDVAAMLAEAEDDTIKDEQWHQRANGSVFWATMTISPLEHNEGYTVISQDTTARKQYERMLEHQNDRLKEFTDILAHDLRNPLNVIDGRLDLYQETGDPEHIESIEATTDRMEQLVDDLIRVARQGNIVTDPEPTDIRDVITTAWEGTGGTADGATLDYETMRPVSADADRLCELFENLLRNAVDHAGSDVTVQVGALPDGIYIEDNGPGISEDSREEVFDHGFTTREEGSGYGLSVVRSIANAHGWDVRVATADAGGAQFEITGIEFL